MLQGVFCRPGSRMRVVEQPGLCCCGPRRKPGRSPSEMKLIATLRVVQGVHQPRRRRRQLQFWRQPGRDAARRMKSASIWPAFRPGSTKTPAADRSMSFWPEVAAGGRGATRCSMPFFVRCPPGSFTGAAEDDGGAQAGICQASKLPGSEGQPRVGVRISRWAGRWSC